MPLFEIITCAMHKEWSHCAFLIPSYEILLLFTFLYCSMVQLDSMAFEIGDAFSN